MFLHLSRKRPTDKLALMQLTFMTAHDDKDLEDIVRTFIILRETIR